MESWGYARALHVIGVVFWIGGVAMVTTVLLPAVKRLPREDDPIELFERIESRFAQQSRWTTALVGATGFYLVYALDLWHRFLELRYWWMDAMVLVWLIFTLMLFVLEPLFLHRRIHERAQRDQIGTLRHIAAVHWLLLVLSIATIAGAVAGAHGVMLFN
ncbi:MAG: hypothetical protein ACXWCY_22440 [Burkholderiales bacterium]